LYAWKDMGYTIKNKTDLVWLNTRKRINESSNKINAEYNVIDLKM
jgi:hypothetical protein